MRSYEEISERIFARGDEMIRRKKIIAVRRRRIVYSVSGLCAVLIVGAAVWNSDLLRNGKENLSFESGDISASEPQTTSADVIAVQTTTAGNIEYETTTQTAAAERDFTSVTSAAESAVTVPESEGQAVTTALAAATAYIPVTSTDPAATSPAETTEAVTTAIVTDISPQEYLMIGQEIIPESYPATPTVMWSEYKENGARISQEQTAFVSVLILPEDISAEIGAIKGVNYGAAAAVRYTGAEEFYVYLNTSYKPASLGGLLSDFGISRDDLNVTGKVMTDEERSALWSAVCSSSGAKLTDTGFSEETAAAVIEVSSPVLPDGSDLSLSESGTLTAHFSDMTFSFDTGDTILAAISE